MFIADIKRVVEQVSRDKGIDRLVLIKALEEALKSAARKKFGSRIDIEVHYDEESGEIEVFQFKEVVEEIVAEEISHGPQAEMSMTRLAPETVHFPDPRQWCRYGDPERKTTHQTRIGTPSRTQESKGHIVVQNGRAGLERR